MNEDTQVLLLLTARFSRQNTGDTTPLTPLEWGRLAVRLREIGVRPSAFFKKDAASILEDWRDNKITPERIHRLLDRAVAMGIALDKWLRSGLWVMTCYDPDYPSKLIDRLPESYPPVIFGCGNRGLLSLGGIAVVGSRDASGEELAYTKFLGRHITMLGTSVVSGGARGVDETAMLAALENSGAAVGVLADSLLAAAASQKYRQYLMRDDLALV